MVLSSYDSMVLSSYDPMAGSEPIPFLANFGSNMERDDKQNVKNKKNIWVYNNNMQEQQKNMKICKI
jgi:hypothetical protein